MNDQRSIVNAPSSWWQTYWHILVLVVLSLLIFVIAGLTPVDYGGSDSHFSLIVSQSLLENKTFYVEAYKERIPEQFETYGGLQLRNWQSHIYYRYPLGTSLFAVPFVWAVNQFVGLDMLEPFHNHLTQNFIASLTVAAAFWLLYGLARCYVDKLSSIVIAFIFTVGSSIMSTMGTALWNMNFLVVFELAVLWLIARYETGHTKRPYSFVIGLLLFAAFFTRPTAAIFISIILVYLFFKHRPVFWTAALTAGVCLAAFLLFSWTTYGEILPPYYAAGSWIDPGNIVVALGGILVSPSRGLFVYSSFLLITAVGIIYYFSALKRIALFWVGLVWFCLLALVVASTRNWWGGYSFGPRLLTDALPAWGLLTILLWHTMQQTATTRMQYGAAAAFIILGLFSGYIHSYQGTFSWQAVRWNGSLPPMVDQHPETIFDWRYPQFLATEEMICARNLAYIDDIAQTDTPLITYTWGNFVFYDGDRYFNIHGDNPAQRRQKELLAAQGQLPPESEPVPNQALFAGWGSRQENKRNTACEQASIFLKLGHVNPDKTYELTVMAEAQPGTIAKVAVNGQRVGTVVFAEGEGGETAVFSIPGSLWRANSLNEIQFHIPSPETHPEQTGWQIGLHQIQITETD